MTTLLRMLNAAVVRALGVCMIACVCGAGTSAAQDPSTATVAAPKVNKLTLAYYHFSSDNAGMDINLRHTFASSTAWIGGYRESDGFEQVRVGYEYDYRRRSLTLVPSIQGATHGFLAATMYGEVGPTLFAIGGFGRTNLQPYWNLAFDPNDYIQFGAGYRDRAGNTLSAYAIRDNRRHTGQTNTHMFFRRYLRDQWRVTLDAMREHGTGDEQVMVRAWAVSVDVDWRAWFVRVAEDPHVNYTVDRQLRVAAGLRF
jgi:hypothetical protein